MASKVYALIGGWERRSLGFNRVCPKSLQRIGSFMVGLPR